MIAFLAQAQSAFAALVVSFPGWDLGLAMPGGDYHQDPADAQRHAQSSGIAYSLAAFGWVCWMPPHAGLVWLGVLLIVCYVSDRKRYHGRCTWEGWLTMRFRLTVFCQSVLLPVSGSDLSPRAFSPPRFTHCHIHMIQHRIEGRRRTRASLSGHLRWRNPRRFTRVAAGLDSGQLRCEFARHLSPLRASQQGRDCEVTAVDKCTWDIRCEGRAPLTVQYEVYAFDTLGTGPFTGRSPRVLQWHQRLSKSRWAR